MRSKVNFFTNIILSITIIILSACAIYTTTTQDEVTVPAFYLKDDSYRRIDLSGNNDSKLNPLIRLHTKDDKFFCSGTVISSNLVLTAAHCVNTLKTKKVLILDVEQRVKVQAEVIAFASEPDYALIEGDFSQFNAAPIETRMQALLAETPRDVIACGFPRGETESICETLVFQQFYVFKLALTGFYQPGMSGGPVVNPMNGKLVAINSAAGTSFVIAAPLIGIIKAFNLEL